MKTSIYLPDDLAARMRSCRISLSKVCAAAIEAAVVEAERQDEARILLAARALIEKGAVAGGAPSPAAAKVAPRASKPMGEAGVELVVIPAAASVVKPAVLPVAKPVVEKPKARRSTTEMCVHRIPGDQFCRRCEQGT